MARPIVLVHGYNFDPSKPGDRNPHDTVFREWKLMLPEDRRIIEFGYFSAGGPSKFKMLMRAWTAGYRNAYRWAYTKLAVDAATELAERAQQIGSCDVICHSLGSRVVLLAARLGAPFKRVIIMGGAEMVPIARRGVLLTPGIRYLNVMSKTDDILDLMAENFTPGDYDSAMGCDGVPDLVNLKNVVLDSEEVQDWATKEYGWYLNGDMDNWMDHHVYYRWAGNWPMYIAFLNGDDIVDMPDTSKSDDDVLIV